MAEQRHFTTWTDGGVAWGNVVSFQNGEQQYMYCQHSIVRSGRTLCLASPRRPTPNHGLGHCCVVGEIGTEDACYTLLQPVNVRGT